VGKNLILYLRVGRREELKVTQIVDLGDGLGGGSVLGRGITTVTV
jgi:hypothetical protein